MFSDVGLYPLVVMSAVGLVFAEPEEGVTAPAGTTTDIGTAMRRANLPEVMRLIDRFFGETAYSLTSLFADEQHRILHTILNQTISEMEDSLRKIYEDHASLLHFLTESGMAAPPALATAAGCRVAEPPLACWPRCSPPA